ncbi:MAG: gliding motility-associated C-terminal domain-containing protein [Bacteroidales bacterium]|nr:gliding motility-associated C-terminal domain-containing protein [Bacteroidales bacterium]
MPDIPAEPDLLYVFTKVDTQYVEIQTFDVEGHLVQPGRDAIRVPFGTKVKLVAEATGGSRQYIYLWTPDELLDRHDNTMASVSTLRLYEDGAVILMIRDTVTGCSDTLQVLISMSDEIGDIPNAFSPNGDGINDIFMGGTGADVVIFDRFGRELFRSTDQEGWDGTYKGKPVSPGEYLYVVTIRKNGQEYVKKGTVTVFTK